MGDKLKEKPEPWTLAVALVPLAEFGHLTPLKGEKNISKLLFYKSDPLNNTFLNCWFLPY